VRESSDLGPEYFAYSPGGDVQARRDPQGGTERSGGAPQDGLGRPVLRDGWALHYGAAGRLARAERLHSTGHARGLSASAAAARAVEVRLAYNALGERVRKTVLEAGGHGQITGFAYFDQRLVAELDAQGRVVRHYLHWQGRPLAVIDIDPRRPGRVQSLHHLLTDPLGTPHRAIDTAGRIVWDARYQSYGAIQHARGTFRQPLRLPGQYHDEETGLYDNYLRTYDPHRGRYLEPDPLGLAGGLNRHAYVNGRPHAASDPLGLILFAFDGTENSRPARAPDTLSNVARLFSLYEGDDGHYMNGVGVDDPATGIRATLFDRYDAGSARARVDAMLEALDRALRALGTAGEEVTVDVIGFSRGAAMARDFSNSVAARIRTGHYARLDRCVSLNFVGLWDTVAQFGLNGLANDRWNLSIPDEARVVVHAVAANEHRRFFPLESILRSPTADSGRAVTRPGAHARSPSGRVRVEEAFVGDHADIGGSHGEGDLADVSLAWMYRHAKAAGVDLAAIDPQWEVVSHPLVHDNRSPAQPGPDREVRYRDAPRARPVAVTQRQMPGTALSTAQATELIRYDPAPRLGSRSPIVGEVDIAAYADWLDQTLGLRIGY
jgi:RHS repeat-associated protein